MEQLTPFIFPLPGLPAQTTLNRDNPRPKAYAVRTPKAQGVPTRPSLESRQPALFSLQTFNLEILVIPK